MAETLQKISSEIPSVYDEKSFPESDFQTELDIVHEATKVERRWIEATGLQPYESDEAVLREVADKQLVRVGQGTGFIAIQRLLNWTLERSDPDHQFHYSPPYIRPNSFDVLQEIADKWQAELGSGRFLSVTSLTRSIPYQQNLATKKRKVTILEDGLLSSHLVGIAFDIDGCGIVETDDNGVMRVINPRAPGFRGSLLAESRMVLRQLLEDRKYDGQINFVEELPGTQEHCFHVCVKPPTFVV